MRTIRRKRKGKVEHKRKTHKKSNMKLKLGNTKQIKKKNKKSKKIKKSKREKRTRGAKGSKGSKGSKGTNGVGKKSMIKGTIKLRRRGNIPYVLQMGGTIMGETPKSGGNVVETADEHEAATKVQGPPSAIMDKCSLDEEFKLVEIIGGGISADIYRGKYGESDVAGKLFRHHILFERAVEIHYELKDMKFRHPSDGSLHLGGIKLNTSGDKIIAGEIDDGQLTTLNSMESQQGARRAQKGYIILFEYIEGKNMYEYVDDKNGEQRRLMVEKEKGTRRCFSCLGTTPVYRNDAITPEDCKRFVTYILRQLVPLHIAGYAHRDIKLDNIMIEQTTGFARLIDFDYTKKGAIPSTSEPEYDGTLGYIAPEVEHELKFNDYRPTDMYSLGVVILNTLMFENIPVDGAGGRSEIITYISTKGPDGLLLSLLIRNLLSDQPHHRFNAWNTYILLTEEDPNTILTGETKYKVSDSQDFQLWAAPPEIQSSKIFPRLNAIAKTIKSESEEIPPLTI